ncbi:50S ribosomal protein L18e [Methanotorris igneus]|uniref:Large ribosomal subunit protein eL18 n=1 Tax=Methanotorris igneus (strain DSM 5666 / JCM 11834 / Kol 5) TaxID=880724 RepID=F6BD46_METIK|nr:50S ribosomal protein L18e [Methanotorris igneus]AEF96407.1 50S ribosomal protein L18e [Methanotorris igneus Kol 5]
MKKIRATNPRLVALIQKLKEEAYKNNAKIWKDIARRLAKPARNRAEVNVSKINRYTKEGDVVVVPGKVLGAGTINHKVTVAAFAFSKTAKQIIEAAGGRCITIEELVKENPKGSNVKIMA